VWVYPATDDVVKECGMDSISHYIGIRRETIFWYVVDRRILKKCIEGERRQGLAPRQWWWEQKMSRQTELENRGISVGLIDGIRSALLNGGVGFAWNVGESIGPLTGGGCAAPLWRLR